jgi:hypothetical protein
MNDKREKIRPVKLMQMIPEIEEEFFYFFRKNLDNYDYFSRYWKWRNDNSLVSKGEGAVIAKDENIGIIGCVGIAPVEVCFAREEIRTSWQQDSLVSSSARGMGVGKKLVLMANKDCELNLAKGTSSSMYGLRKSLGYKDVPNSNYLLRVCHFKWFQGGVAKKIIFLILRFWSLFLSYPKLKQNFSIQKIDEFDDSFDELAELVVEENTIRPNKGKDFLNWRYTKCPGKKYTILKAGSSKTCGAIFLNCSGNGSDEGWIVDMVCKSNDMDCVFALVHAAMSFFKENHISRIWCFATHPLIRKWFYRFGFVPTNKSPKFTYFTGNTKLQEKLSGCHWDFWHGDGDIELYQ